MINKGNSVRTQGLTNVDLFYDEETDRKIHRHLSDINDKISEQDIKNVKTDFNADRDGTLAANEPV